MFFTALAERASGLATRKLAGGFVVALAAWACLVCSAQAAGYQPQGEGVAYLCDQNPRIPVTVHVIRIDRAQKDLEFHVTLGGITQIGMGVLSSQVNSIPPAIGKAIAGINGDYFFHEDPFVGAPMNLHIRRGGELITGPGLDRAFFYQDATGNPHITNVVDKFSIIWPNGKTTPFGLNQSPETGQAVLFTSAIGPSTRVEGVDLILERNGQAPWLPLRIGQTISAKVKQVNKNGYSKIPPDGLVLSLSPRNLKLLPPLTPGMEIKISTATVPDLCGAVMAIGGGPSLVRGGKARSPGEYHSYYRRDPRTAMGWNDKYYYFVQVDGRQPRYSMGMTLPELAEYFVKLGCVAAINLDGGGSCTTWLSGKIINSPSQGRERPSANALVLVRKANK